MQVRDAFLTIESTTEGRNALRLTALGGVVRAGAAQILPACPELSTVMQADGPVVVVEGFAGDSLAALLQTGPLRSAQAIRLLRSMATAVDELHRMGFVHGRLRPGSFVVDGLQNSQPRVRLVDWAIQWQPPTPGQIQQLSHALAPELIFGEAALAASDQFAFGALAHQLLTGHLPFGGESTSETLLATLSGHWSLGEAGELPVDALSRVFSHEPAQRFNSCTAFVDAMDREIAEATAPLAAPAAAAYSGGYSAPVAAPVEAAEPGWWARNGLLVAGLFAALAFALGIASWFVQRQIADVQASVGESMKAAKWTLADNGRMKVCNNSQHQVLIRDLAVGYWDSARKLTVFESSRAQHGGWTVEPESEQNLSSLAGPWDGSVVFYYLHVEQQGKEYLLSGTWQEVPKGCLAIASQ